MVDEAQNTNQLHGWMLVVDTVSRKKKKSSKSLTDYFSSIPRPVLLHDACSTHVAEIRVEGDDEIELGVLHDQDFLLNGHDLTYMFHQSNRTVYSPPALFFLKWK